MKQPVTVELHYGGTWNVAPVYVRDPISIVRGRADRASDPTPATMTATIDNRSTDYNPRNPMSSLYGLIGRNTPLRAGLTIDADNFGRTVSAGWGSTSTGGSGWAAFGGGGTVAPTDSSVSGGQGRHLVPVANAFRACLLWPTYRDVEVAVTVTPSVSNVAGGNIEPGGLLLRWQGGANYYLARLEISPAEAVTVAVYGPSGVLTAAPVPVVWTGQALRIRASIVGSILSVKAWDPATGEPAGWLAQVVDDQLPAAGSVGVRSGVAGGNTNVPVTFAYDDFTVIDRRYTGEVAGWRPGRTLDFDPATGRGDAWTGIEAAGILRRIAAPGADVLPSPLRHALDGTAPTAYWPLEDGSGALAAASAVTGVPPMTVFGYSRFQAPGTGLPVPAAGLPAFASGEGIPGSAPVPAWTRGGVLVGRPPVPVVGTQSWRVAFVAVLPRDKQAAATIFAGWTVNAGTYTVWEVEATSTGLDVYASDPATFIIGYRASTAAINLFDGLPHFIEIEGKTTAGLLDVRVYIDGWEYGSLATVAAPNLAYPPGWIESVSVNPKEWTSGEPQVEGMPQLGHVAVWQPTAAIGGHVQAMLGHVGETTAERFLQLCAQQGVDALVVGNPADCPTMGVQRIATFGDLLAEIERTDDGLIFEPRDWLGLVLRTGASLAGQQPALEVDWSARQVADPFDPVIDDQGTRNDVTARSSTTDGTARAVLETGRMSVQPPPDGVGRSPTQLDVNPADDGRLPDHAGWALHVGTVDEVRIAALTVDLVASPGLLAAASAVDVGDRVDLTGLPVDVAPDEVRLLSPGQIETIGSHSRQITVNAVPYAPYEQVAVADGDPRAPADGSTLHAGITAGATTLQIASTVANGPWTTVASDFPIPVRIDGERADLDAPGAVLNANPWMLSGSAGWSAVSAAASWTATPARPGTRYGSLQITAAGGGSGGATASTRVAVTVAARYIATLWAYVPVGTVTLGPAVDWHNSGGGYLSTSIPTSTSVPAGVWTPLSAVVTAPASAASAAMRARHDGATPGGTVYYVTAVTIAPEAGTLVTPQTFTATRSLNGVARAWPAGTTVDVWTPAVAAL